MFVLAKRVHGHNSHQERLAEANYCTGKAISCALPFCSSKQSILLLYVIHPACIHLFPIDVSFKSCVRLHMRCALTNRALDLELGRNINWFKMTSTSRQLCIDPVFFKSHLNLRGTYHCLPISARVLVNVYNCMHMNRGINRKRVESWTLQRVYIHVRTRTCINYQQLYSLAELSERDRR